MVGSPDGSYCRRRPYLTGVAGLLTGLAGCTGTDGLPTRGTTNTASDRRTATTTTEQSGSDDRKTLYVSPDGDADATGARDDPLGSIQTAFERARPGVTVHALAGEYREAVRTVRSGTADAPITLTGPREAVFRGNPDADHAFGLHIEHSHVHLRGMTFDGFHDPANPDSSEAYITSLITARHTPRSPDGYHRNLVIKPDAIGNSLRAAVHVMYSEQVEIGEFEVVGPAGLAMLEFGDDRNHNGEIVYVGTAPGDLAHSGTSSNFDGEPDRTNNVHVHHIDNSAGHPHAELVDIKPGSHDVLVEYCTDGGGGAEYTLPGAPPTSESVIHVGGRKNTIRWNVVANSNGQGVQVQAWGAAHPDRYREQQGTTYPDSLVDQGRENSIYGNRITGSRGLGIQYPFVYTDDGETELVEGYGPDAQAVVCGNDIESEAHGTPEKSCSDSVPTTDRIGRLGGDSPWSG